MDIIVSVIIPAYNVENYIYRGIESVINQTVKNIELIIVDDGSSDKTYSVLEEYSNRDSRIKIIYQENQGVSVARNRGIKEAVGKYMIFLDSDDWLEENAVEILLGLKKDSSPDTLISCSAYINYPQKDGTIKRVQEDTAKETKRITNEEALMRIGHMDDIVIRSSCYKLFDTDVIKKNKIFFEPKIYNGEDGLFVFTYLLYTKRVLFNPVPLWNVLKRNGSSTSSYNSGWLTAIDAVEYMMKAPNLTEKIQNNLKVYLTDRAMGVAVGGLRSKKMTKDEFVRMKIIIENDFCLWKKEQSNKIRVLKRIIFLLLPYEILKFFLKKNC